MVASKYTTNQAGTGFYERDRALRTQVSRVEPPVIRGFSSVGRASRLQCEGRRFEPDKLHWKFKSAIVGLEAAIFNEWDNGRLRSQK